MRSLAVLLFALLTVSVEVAQADELLKRKPGLWELSWHSNDVTPAQSPIQQSIGKMCIDATTDAKLAAAYDACDPPLDLAFYLPQFKKELVCKATAADLTVITRSTITFSGDTAYRIENKSRFEPALKGEGDLSGGREGKWVSTCPADMRPGDLSIGDEPKVNVFEELAKPNP